jgi:hypothetical protein
MIAPTDRPLATAYFCPNKTGCGMSFASQAECSKHLTPQFFTPDSLRVLFLGDSIGKPYGPSCLHCGYEGEREVYLGLGLPVERAFAKGIKLQKSLAGTSDGLAPCIAEFVTRDDSILWCSSCGEVGEIGEQLNRLEIVSAEGLEEVAEVLLSKGADVNAQCEKVYASRNYVNALQAAIVNGHEKVVDLLLNKGADVHAQGGYYGNALQAALVHSDEKTIKLLLNKGADVNAQGGYLAMHWERLY